MFRAYAPLQLLRSGHYFRRTRIRILVWHLPASAEETANGHDPLTSRFKVHGTMILQFERSANTTSRVDGYAKAKLNVYLTLLPITSQHCHAPESMQQRLATKLNHDYLPASLLLTWCAPHHYSPAGSFTCIHTIPTRDKVGIKQSTPSHHLRLRDGLPGLSRSAVTRGIA